MTHVLDASVIVKWFAESWNDEGTVHEATSLLRSLQSDEIEVIQPPHWKAEVVSVLARRQPDGVTEALLLMDGLDIECVDNWEVYLRAAKMSVELNHHLFDTLYHAVALEHGAEFITADKQYFNKARSLGSITLLG